MYTFNLNEDFYNTFLLNYKNKHISVLRNVLLDDATFDIVLLLCDAAQPICLMHLQLAKDYVPILDKYDFNVFSFREILESHNLSLGSERIQVGPIDKNLKALSLSNLGDKALIVNYSVHSEEATPYFLKAYFLTDVCPMDFTLG